MTTYTIDIDAANDSGAGDAFAPWKFLDSHKNLLLPGDIVQYVGGNSQGTPKTYTEVCTINDNTGANDGTAGLPITIRPVPGQYVLFSTTTAGAYFRLDNLSYWIIDGGTHQGFEFDCRDRQSSGFAIKFKYGSNLTLKNCRIHNGKYPELVSVEASAEFLIESCTIWDNFIGPGSDAAAINLQVDAGPTTGGKVRYCTLYDCTDGVVQNWVSGQTTWLWHDLVIEYNLIYTTQGAIDENAVDLKSSVNAIVKGNTAHGYRYNDGSQGGSGNGGVCAMQSHSYSTGTKFWNNKFYDISGAAIAMTSGGGEIVNNECWGGVYETPAGYSTNDRAWFRFYSAAGSSCKFYNNTVHGRFGGNGHVVSIGANVTVYAENNIFYETGTIYLRSGSVFTASYNCWHNCAETAAGTGDVNSNPLFNNVGSNDYRLTASSPCLNAGHVITGYTEGRTYGANPDMGANEYGYATKLVFSGFPSTGIVSENLQSFTVRAERYDNTLDTSHVDSVFISKATGPGSLTGILSINCVAGIATFGGVKITAAGTYTINASGDAITVGVSGSIVISLPSNNTTLLPVSTQIASAPQYKLVLRTPTGARLAEVIDDLQLFYRKERNSPGLLTFSLLESHRVVSLITRRAQVEVWRRNLSYGLNWYRDFSGIFVDDDEWQQGPPARVFFNCPGDATMLNWREIAWEAGLDGRTSFDGIAPETIAKTLVNYNIAALATIGNNRERNGALTLVTISTQTDAASGTPISFTCAQDNLLESLKKLAKISGADFALVKTGPATYEFRWYPNGSGADRTATLSFSTKLDNIANARYRRSAIESKTVAIVGGQKSGSNRDFVISNGPDHTADYDIEYYHNASGQASTEAAYEAEAQRVLTEKRAKSEFSFDVKQTPNAYYGLHYCVNGELGDRVGWFYRTGLEGTARINAVGVGWENKQEAVNVEVEENA